MKGARAAVVIAMGVVALTLAAAPASAHTSLVESEPPDRATLAASPERLRLVFAAEVVPRLVTLDIVDVRGGKHPGAVRVTPDRPPATIIEFTLPELPDDLYGLQWRSLGLDGHRVAGEVVVSVGPGSATDLSGASFSAVSTVDRALDVALPVGRFVWYLGLALVAGGLLVSRWTSRGGTGEEALRPRARRAVVAGASIGLTGAVVRAAAVVAIFAGGLGGVSASTVGDALTSGPGLLALGAVAAGIAARIVAGSHAARADGAVAVLLGTQVVLFSIGGHAVTQPLPGLAVVTAALHVAAAAVWIGPLIVILAGARRIDQVHRAVTLQRLFARYARVAAWSFAALALSGLRAAWVMVGTRFFDSGYGVALAIKLGLVAAVVAPLGFFHDRAVRVGKGRARPAREKRARAAVGSRWFGRTLRTEVSAIVLILGVAAVLSGLDPLSDRTVDGGAGSALATGLSARPVTGSTGGDPNACAELIVGKPSCYREYFAGLMRDSGADVAVAKLFELSTTDDFVKQDCHGVAHDLGRDAAEFYGDLGTALSFDASACWSGYYHGVVEATLSDFADDELATAIPGACASVADPRYSFDHYNCVHGVGHGVMLRFKADLFRSLPLCEAYADAWEMSSCVGGAFMENVVQAQAGEPATFRDDDPLYPCTAVQEQYRDECYAMQTSYILWDVGYDYAATFRACDGAPEGYIDDCYQSLGRDISGAALLDPATVIQRCDLGAPAYREFCIVGASLNAVFNDRATGSATALCEAVDQRYRAACEAARDRAAGQI